MDFFVGTHSRNGAVVFHAYEEPPAIRVGEGSQRTGNALAVRNLELEIEHLVLALLDQVLDMVLFCLHRGAKIGLFSMRQGTLY